MFSVDSSMGRGLWWLKSYQGSDFSSYSWHPKRLSLEKTNQIRNRILVWRNERQSQIKKCCLCTALILAMLWFHNLQCSKVWGTETQRQ